MVNSLNLICLMLKLHLTGSSGIINSIYLLGLDLYNFKLIYTDPTALVHTDSLLLLSSSQRDQTVTHSVHNDFVQGIRSSGLIVSHFT